LLAAQQPGEFLQAGVDGQKSTVSLHVNAGQSLELSQIECEDPCELLSGKEYS
jgi:hypothetical protein